MRACPLAVLLAIAGIVCFGQTPQVTQEAGWGYVDGVAVDGGGKPLSGATITAYYESHEPAVEGKTPIRPVTQYSADEQGKFNLKFPEGKVWLLAHKSSEEYPYAFFAFYLMPGQDFPTVEIKSGRTIRGIVVRVGAKAAHLNYEVIDEDGKAVGGGFDFIRLDQKVPYSLGAIAKGDLLVPPVPFRATFEAKGYKPWHYGGDKWRGKE